MIETLSIDEFEGQVILIHKRSDGWRDACLLTGPYAGELIQVIPEKIFPIRFDRYGNVVYGPEWNIWNLADLVCLVLGQNLKTKL